MNFTKLFLGLILIYLFNSCFSEYQVITSKDTPSEHFFLKILYPVDLLGFFVLSPAKVGPHFNTTYTNGTLYIAQPEHACSNLQNSKNMTGKVALIIRGGCSFVTKIINAQLAGSIAVVIYDFSQLHKRYISMVPDDTGRQVNIPSAFMNGVDGYRISSTLSRLNLESATVTFPLNVTGFPIFNQKVITWTLW